MVEFGEKIKQLREEKGMTQQTMAEKLYVTRQAVSRWECGARYPDLLTAKKIAQILEVTIDELVSGEEVERDIKKEPILATSVENTIQTVLYTIAVIAYLLMCIFCVHSFFPSESLKQTPAGKITLSTIATTMDYGVNFIVMAIGLLLSIRNRLTAKKVAYIMAVPYALMVNSYIFMMIQMFMKGNGNQAFYTIFKDCFMPFIVMVYIWLYFTFDKWYFSCYVIYGICVLELVEIFKHIHIFYGHFTDLGLTVSYVHCIGKAGIILLLGYQAYVWNKKRMFDRKNKIKISISVDKG